MFEGLFVDKTWNGKIIAHRDLRWSIASFALSLGLLFMGSSSAIFAQGERRNQRREIHKPRPEIKREAYNRRPKKDPKPSTVARKKNPKPTNVARKKNLKPTNVARRKRPKPTTAALKKSATIANAYRGTV